MKKESQQNQSRWWIWYHNAVWGIRTCLPRLRRKARRKPNLKVRTYLWARWMYIAAHKNGETRMRRTIIPQSCQVKMWIGKHGETRILLKHQKSCWINQPKSQNQIKMRITNRYGETVFSEKPEWLQEFRENLVDDRVPEHRDSHASSSHELSLGPHEKCGFG